MRHFINKGGLDIEYKVPDIIREVARNNSAPHGATVFEDQKDERHAESNKGHWVGHSSCVRTAQCVVS